MQRPPRPASKPVIDRGVIVTITGIGVAMTVTGLPLFFYILSSSRNAVLAQTLLFTLLVLAEMVALQVIRSRYGLTILSNRWLIAAVLSSLALQALVLYTPLNRPFGVIPIGAGNWTWLAGVLFTFTLINIAIHRFRRKPALSSFHATADQRGAHR
jgi:Ca2+-transporting ATPase